MVLGTATINEIFWTTSTRSWVPFILSRVSESACQVTAVRKSFSFCCDCCHNVAKVLKPPSAYLARRKRGQVVWLGRRGFHPLHSSNADYLLRQSIQYTIKMLQRFEITAEVLQGWSSAKAKTNGKPKHYFIAYHVKYRIQYCIQIICDLGMSQTIYYATSCTI
jgi:hypothetical protein